MASVEECQAVLTDLGSRLGAVDESVRRHRVPDRTVSLRLSDLDVTFSAVLRGGELRDLALCEPTLSRPRAQVRITTTSQDLVSLAAGHTQLGAAWATGRVKVEASPLDLLRLGTLTT